jgi:hypothetical protein
MKSLKLAVIIINYKTPDLVIDVLESLKTELVYGQMEAVVVDNYSQDDSIVKLNKWIETNDSKQIFKLIESDENAGFSSGNNKGIQAVDAENYLLLNSDTIVRKGAVQSLLDTINSQPRVGLVGPRLEWLDGTPQESCFNYHSPISELINSAATGPITALFSKFVVAQPVKFFPDYYSWTSFACVLIRKRVFEDIGLMDAGYFMYYEDVAFSRKAQQAGWLVMNNPAARVVHLRGGTSPVKENAKLKKRLPRYYFESRTRYFYQFYGWGGLLTANILWSLGWFITEFRSLVSRSYTSKAAKLQWLDIWTNFWNPTKKYIHPSKYRK